MYLKKKLNLFLNLTRNVSNVNGASIYKDSLLERYLPSINRRNEVPIEPVRVGPGINRGYTERNSPVDFNNKIFAMLLCQNCRRITCS